MCRVVSPWSVASFTARTTARRSFQGLFKIFIEKSAFSSLCRSKNDGPWVSVDRIHLAIFLCRQETHAVNVFVHAQTSQVRPSLLTLCQLQLLSGAVAFFLGTLCYKAYAGLNEASASSASDGSSNSDTLKMPELKDVDGLQQKCHLKTALVSVTFLQTRTKRLCQTLSLVVCIVLTGTGSSYRYSSPIIVIASAGILMGSAVHAVSLYKGQEVGKERVSRKCSLGQESRASCFVLKSSNIFGQDENAISTYLVACCFENLLPFLNLVFRLSCQYIMHLNEVLNQSTILKIN